MKLFTILTLFPQLILCLPSLNSLNPAQPYGALEKKSAIPNSAPDLQALNHELGLVATTKITTDLATIHGKINTLNLWAMSAIDPLTISLTGLKLYIDLNAITDLIITLTNYILGILPLAAKASIAEALEIQLALEVFQARWVAFYVTIIAKEASIQALLGAVHRANIREALVRSKLRNKALFDAVVDRLLPGAVRTAVLAKLAALILQADAAIAIC